jgi:hypothetical protein
MQTLIEFNIKTITLTKFNTNDKTSSGNLNNLNVPQF